MTETAPKSQCPKCAEQGRDNSEDNLSTYADGQYCHSCGYSAKEEPINGMIEKGEYRALTSRSLSKETCQKYDISIGEFTGNLGKNNYIDNGKVVVLNQSEKGKLVKQKIRSVADSHKTTQRGDTKKNILFGQHAFTPNENRFITITEGEFDAASVYQTTDRPAVSITTGASGAKKELSQHLKWLNKWKYVILAFDNDEAGQAATQECLDLFEPGKVRIAHWPLKDANEMLVANRGPEIMQCLWDAEEYAPEDIITVGDVIGEILDRPVVGLELPWKPMTDIMYGLRPNEIICVAGGTGLGKTEFIKDIILHLGFHLKERVGLFSFEQKPADTMRRLIGGVIGKPLHIPGEWWDPKVIEETSKMFDDVIYSCGRQGPMGIPELSNLIRYLCKAKGVKFFVVDHLKALAATMTNKLTGVEDAMANLKGLCNELNCTIILVCHLAKDKKLSKTGQDDESWRDGRVPVLENVYGSSAVEAWADFVFAISRNANSEFPSEQLRTKVQCLKARLDGTKSGARFDLLYNVVKGRLEEMQ